MSPQDIFSLFFFFFFFLSSCHCTGAYGPGIVGNELDRIKVLNRRVGGEKNLLHNLGLLCSPGKDARSGDAETAAGIKRSRFSIHQIIEDAAGGEVAALFS